MKRFIVGVGLCAMLVTGCGKADQQSAGEVSASGPEQACDRAFVQAFALHHCAYLARQSQGMDRGESPESRVGNPGSCGHRKQQFIYEIGTEASNRVQYSDFMTVRDPSTGQVLTSAVSGACINIVPDLVAERCAQNPDLCS